jgi:hypothetical protein
MKFLRDFIDRRQQELDSNGNNKKKLDKNNKVEEVKLREDKQRHKDKLAAKKRKLEEKNYVEPVAVPMKITTGICLSINNTLILWLFFSLFGLYLSILTRL